MSNCITLHEHDVIFSPEEFDIVAFEQIRKEHLNHKDNNNEFTIALLTHKELPKGSLEVGDTFCWFLRQNSQVLNTGCLLINFGQGASGHTWRDFKHTIWFLNQFVKKQKKHTFMISDEGDGYNSIFPITIRWPYESFDKLWKSL